MSRTMQDVEQIVSDYLAELLTPAPAAAPAAEVKVVSIETWRDADAAGRGADPRYLLCSAAGVKLAVPMADVTHMLPMPPLTPPNTTNPICMGRWRHPSGEARVADLGAILSPDMAGASTSTLVILGNRAWALGCVVDDEPVELMTDAIQWRHGATSRPWLAGMSKEPKCGVVETAALIRWLEQELGP
ncbi:chemotaxis protein CheW [Luteibacter aegosomatis]|uniref:chemotaxis protein CheW n=1 Tax=Luteibacter aegosomatis TaxID=2911537 RepID=UPI001FFAAE93|nr:chemotaxis protein CheW [Luteibacter aegosomatis]UPG86931.1 chemotaxis protein CheW [Luteibacter aegosomatis]